MCVGAGSQVAGCSQDFFEGAIDDVSMFGTALSTGDVTTLTATPAHLPSNDCAWQEVPTVSTEVTSTQLVNCSFDRTQAYSVVVYVESAVAPGNNDGELQTVRLDSAPIGIHMHSHLTPEVIFSLVFSWFLQRSHAHS